MTSKNKYIKTLDKFLDIMKSKSKPSFYENEKDQIAEDLITACKKADLYDELTQEPTLSECIKEWEENYGVLQNDEYYLEVIDEWNVRILIDKKTKRYQCYSVSDDIRRLETSMLVEIDAHNLIHKTLKALEKMEDE